MQTKYSDAFELLVVKDNYISTLGVGSIALNTFPVKTTSITGKKSLLPKDSCRKTRQNRIKQLTVAKNRLCEKTPEPIEKFIMRTRLSNSKPESTILSR